MRSRVGILVGAAIFVAACSGTGAGQGDATGPVESATSLESSTTLEPAASTADDNGVATATTDTAAATTPTTSLPEGHLPRPDATGEDFERIYRELDAYRGFVSAERLHDLVGVAQVETAAEETADWLLDLDWADLTADRSGSTYTVDAVEVYERITDDRVLLLVTDTVIGTTRLLDASGEEVDSWSRDVPQRQYIVTMLRGEDGFWRIADDWDVTSQDLTVVPVPDDFEVLEEGSIGGLAWRTGWFEAGDGSLCGVYEIDDIERLARCLSPSFTRDLGNEDLVGAARQFRWPPTVDFYMAIVWVDEVAEEIRLPSAAGRADPVEVFGVAQTGARVAGRASNVEAKDVTIAYPDGAEWLLPIANQEPIRCDAWQSRNGLGFEPVNDFNGSAGIAPGEVLGFALAELDGRHFGGDQAVGSLITREELPDRFNPLAQHGNRIHLMDAILSITKTDIDREIEAESWLLFYNAARSGVLVLEAAYVHRSCRGDG